MNSIILAADVNFMIKGIFSYQIFGQTVWITTTHVSLTIVFLLFVIFGLCAHHVIVNADPYAKPGTFQNIVELMVEMLDNMITGCMGKSARPFLGYISTLFSFILISNFSGLLGLRPPTADYGVTFPLGLITFGLIFYNKIKHQGVGGFLKGLCDPWPVWAPINVIGDIAVPVSISLRLFANILSGTVMMALVYGLLNKIAWGWPGFLHLYFDLFSGAIQTYVFCMLTMTYVADAIGDGTT